MQTTDKIYIAGHTGLVGSAIMRKLTKFFIRFFCTHSEVYWVGHVGGSGIPVKYETTFFRCKKCKKLLLIKDSELEQLN